ncbi:type VI secretion system ATPase TssH [Sphingomonas sp. 37zxx]|uniref:type VI secretion system ATPase TssH n=1 Tax=Sphingomonas sp. 37zxx TaxID=1550073 RepID=UPI000690DEFF|nr:type VI secretion system ATPase TssH [Sphingomonas sp. 37zxx]
MIQISALLALLGKATGPAMQRAVDDCAARGQHVVEVEHLLHQLVEDRGTDLARALIEHGVDPGTIAAELLDAIGRCPRGAADPPTVSVGLDQTLESAWLIASVNHGALKIGSLCVLRAAIEDVRVRDRVLSAAPSLARLPRQGLAAAMTRLLARSSEAEGVAGGGHALDTYTVDLTERARAGRLDVAIGREEEIEQVIEILLRRRQSNPILVGPAGVGKTAIVEALAQRIAEDRVPASLTGLRIRALDLGAVQAGAKVQGEYEERLRAILEAAESDEADCLLFIDEAHMLIGGGATPGQRDTANLLKPALARGALRVIAATTWSEYRRHIEKDAALSRRFQAVKVTPPDTETAIAILRQLTPRLEAHHGVRILEEALSAAVLFAQRYMADRQLPDSAITVLDTACARVAIAQSDRPRALIEAEARCAMLATEIVRLDAETGAGLASGVSARRTQLEQAQARAEHRRAGIAARWAQERHAVERLSTGGDATDMPEGLAHAPAETPHHAPMIPIAVDRGAVAAIVAGWTGVPAEAMLGNSTRRGADLQAQLRSRIVGQAAAIDTIVRRVQTFRAGLGDPHKPTGVFLLCGPSGVGKTETAIALAELLFGGRRALITVNMSEYQEAHSVSGLKGAPPGYVGYGQGGVLTEAVRRQPYSVLLLDEIEKAHPDVLELFYQVFDRGTIEDSEGVAVDFSHALILLTSNLGDTVIAGEHPLRSARDSALRRELLRHFAPAFLGRLTIVPYLPLGAEQIVDIVQLKLARIAQRFATASGGELTWDARAATAIAVEAQLADAGARGIDAILEHRLLPELSGLMLDERARPAVPRSAHIGIATGNRLYVELAS